MGIPIVIATNGYGTPITEAANGYGTPVEIATNGYGVPVVIVASGGLPVVGSGGGASIYDPASEQIFAAFTTPPTTARKAMIDAAVVALKAAGVWAKLDGLYAFTAADSQAAKINWKQPGTYNCTEVNAPAFATDLGFTGASTKYLDSGFNPATAGGNFVQNSASVFAWSNSDIDSVNAIIGPATAAGSGESMVWPRDAGFTRYYINQASVSNIANTNGSGLFTVTRRAAGTTEAYRNGTSLGTGSIASVAPISQTLAFLKRGAGAFWLGQIAWGGFGSQLSAAEQLALYNALATYNAGPVYDAASLAIFSAFTTPPTTARKDAINAAVVALKTAGVWTKLDALYAFAAADSQAAKINWKAPGTFNCTEVNAPTFTADRGFTGNGSTTYLDTSFNPTTATAPNITQNSAAIFAWSLSDVDVVGGIIGPAATGAGGSMIYPRSAGNTHVYCMDSSVSSWANTDGSGFFCVTRRASNSKEGYRNTTSLGTSSLASAAPLNQNFNVLRRGTNYWTGECAGGGWGSQLSAADETALYNALRTYLTGVGVP